MAEFGLFRHCYQLVLNRVSDSWCAPPPVLAPAWQFTAAMLILGLLLMAAATVETFRAYRESLHLARARWISFVACAARGWPGGLP